MAVAQAECIFNSVFPVDKIGLPARCIGRQSRVVFAVLLLFYCTLAVPLPGHADTLDNILELFTTAGVIDPAIVDAKPLIECLITKGDPAQCVNVQQLATQQLDDAENEAMSEAEKQAQQFLPEDPAIKAVVEIVRAAYDEDWLSVLELTGVKLLGQIACKAGLYWSGPLNPFICGEFAETVLDKAEPVVHEMIQVVASWPNINLWKLVTLFGFEFACEVSPNIPLKDEVCSVLGQAFAALASLGSDLLSAVSDAMESVSTFLSGGGGTKMTTEQYYDHLVRPLMFRRALERLMLNRQDLGMDPAEIKQCVQYNAMFSQLCEGQMSPRLRKEAEALVAYVKTIPDTYYQTWLAPVVKQRAVAQYSFDESSAYQQFIDKIPVSQWETLVQGGLPVYMYVGGGEERKIFYDQIFQECSFRVDDMIYGQGAMVLNEPDLAPGSLLNWTCYQAVGKRFAAEYAQEHQRLKDVVIPGLGQLGCPVKSDGMALEFECQNYTTWGLCLEVSNIDYGINAYCNFNRSNAAKVLGQQLTGILGSKRSIYIEYKKGSSGDFNPRVQSTRPWKQQTCDVLLENFRIRNLLAANRIEVQCTYWEPPEFTEQKQLAKQLVDALNSASGGQTGAADKCRQMWDPLRISCYGHQEMPELPEQFADKNIQACPPDPNRDGVDQVCYVADWTLSTKSGNLDQQGVTKTNGQMPPAIGRIPLPPPGTSGGDLGSGTVKMSDQPVSTVKAATGSGPVTPSEQRQPSLGGPIPVTSGQTPAGCGFDLTYLAAQPPVVEASFDSLAAGDQVRISCRFVQQTRRVEWPVCNEEARKTISVYSSTSGRGVIVVSGIVAVDGQPVNVASIQAGRTEYEKTAIWSFRQAGSHEVSCQVSNPLGATVRGADTYLTETISLEVGSRSAERPAAGFEAAQTRKLNTRDQDSPTALIPAMRGRPAPPGSRSWSGETLQETAPVRVIPPGSAVENEVVPLVVPGTIRDLPGALRPAPQEEGESQQIPR